MKDKNRAANQVLADMMFFDYLKEKVGERKTKTGAYYDLLEKATAGFIAPFLKNHEYVLQADQCHVTISDLAVEWHWHRATVRAFLDKLEEMGYVRRTRFAKYGHYRDFCAILQWRNSYLLYRSYRIRTCR